MKIKKSNFLLSLVLMIVLPGVLLFAQEIPVTTSSKEAKKLFIQGRDKLENAENILASELFDKAIALDPNFALAYIYRSQSGGTQSRQLREKALSLTDKVSEGEKYAIQLVQANVDGNQEKRKECIDQLLKLFPRDKRVHLWNGTYLNSIQKNDEGLASFNKALELDKNFGPALNQLGYAYMWAENWKESEMAFKRYAEAAPNSPNPVDSYAEMLMKSGRFDEAIVNFQKAMTINPTFINSYTGMGLCYILKGDFTKSRECFKQQFEKAPSYNWKLSARLNTTSAYLHEGLFTEALKEYGEILSMTQNEKQYQGEINTIANMGWIHMAFDNLEDAAKCFEQARVLTEKSDLTNAMRENNRLYRKGERFHLLLRVMEFDAAETLLMESKKIIDQRQNPVELENFYGNICNLEERRGNYDKALEALSKTDIDGFSSLYQKALILEKKGDRDAALKAYEKVLNWNWYGGVSYALVRYKAKQKISSNLTPVN